MPILNPDQVGGGTGTGGTGGVTSFDGLTDTPSSKTGKAGQILTVSAGETSLEYQDLSFGDMNKSVYDTDDSGRVDGVDTLPVEDFTDGELLRYDSVSDKMVGTGIIDTETMTDFNDKTLIAGTGSVVIGRNTQSIENLGTNLGVIDLQTGTVRASVDTVIGSNVPLMRQYRDEYIVNGNLDNSSAISTTTDTDITLSVSSNTSINSLTLNFLTAYDFIKLSLLRNGVEVWSNRLSTTFSGAYEYELATPIQINNDGSTYIIRISSETGDAYQYRGRGVDLLPYYTYKKQGYKDVPVQAMPDSTGAVRGGELTYQTTTQFEINNGFGYVISVIPFDGNNALYVEWGQAVVAPSLGSDGVFLVYINANGDHLVIDQALTANDFARDNIILGFFVVASGAITRVETLKFDVNETHSQMYDMFTFLGLTRKGIDIGPATGLSFSASSGELHGRGIGSESGSRLQNVLEVDAVNPSVFDLMLGNTFVDVATNVTTIDPDNYDNAGVLTSVPSNDWQVMCVYKAPVNAGGITVTYGQTTYPTRESAEAGANNDSVNTPPLIADEYNLLGKLLVKEGATDITDINQVKFLGGAKFGSSTISGTLGGGAGGGDMFGAGSSAANEIVTFSDATGKTASSQANITAQAGAIKSIDASGDLIIEQSDALGRVKVDFQSAEYFKVESDTENTGFEIDVANVATTRFGQDGPERIIEVKNVQNSFGAYYNPVTQQASIGTSFVSGYALSLDSFTGTFRPPRLTTTNGTLLAGGVGSSFYDTNLNQWSVKTDSGIQELGLSTVTETLTPAANINLSFKEDYSVFDVAVTQATNFGWSNPRQGHRINLTVTGGFPITFDAEFDQVNLSEVYDPLQPNIITIECVDENTPKFEYRNTKPFAGGVLTADQPVAGKEIITKFTGGSANSVLIMSDRGVYSAFGRSDNIGYWSGRANVQNQPKSYGIENMSRIYFDGKDASTVIDTYSHIEANFVLFSDGELWGWGKNANGQLGLGDTADRYLPELLKTGVSEIISDSSQGSISYTNASMVIRDSDGWIWAAGRNASGVLGLGDSTTRDVWVRLDWIGQNPQKVTIKGASYNYLFAQKSDGSLWFAGRDDHGQSGNGNTSTGRTTAIDVSDAWFGVGNPRHPITAIEGGAGWSGGSNAASYIVYDTGALTVLQASGNNSWGQLGQGNTVASTSPVAINFGANIKEIFARGGPTTVYVVLENGQFGAWGHNAQGQIGNGSTAVVTSPAFIFGNADKIMLRNDGCASNDWQRPIFVKTLSGDLLANGYNGRGQCGVGDTGNVTTPQRVILDEEIVTMGYFNSVGDGTYDTVVALSTTGQLYAWGYGQRENFRLGKDVNFISPTAISGVLSQY